MEKRQRVSILIILTVLCIPFQLIASGKQEKTFFEYRNIREVYLDEMSIYSISVKGADTDVCRLEFEYPDKTRFKVHHDVRGGKLRVWTKDTRVLFSTAAGSHRVSLIIPSEMRVRSASKTGAQTIDSLNGDLEIRSNTGAVSVQDCSGMLKLRADTGAIVVRGADGEIEATTDTGSISFYDVQGSLSLESDTGAVYLDRILGTLSVDTDTGSIKADELLLNGDSSFSADTGSIILDLDNAMEDLKVFAKSDIGRIRIYDTEARKHHVWGSGRLLVEVMTDTGSITVK